MLRLTLLTSLVIGTWALTTEELAAFKPRVPDYEDPNTNKKADVYARDNNDGSQLIHSNGVPSHETWVFPQESTGNPNELLEVVTDLKINTDPVFLSEPLTCLPMGYIGIATSGTAIFSWFPAIEGCDDVKNFEELDICEGHPAPNNLYHYHYYSPCVQMPVCGEPSPIYGVALDGIPIYGPISEDGVQLTNEDLDECGGRTDKDGRYKYHVTADPQYFISCLKGEIRSDLGKPMMDFTCSCPYDDTMFKRGAERTRPATVCTASDTGSEALNCTDKDHLNNLAYEIPYVWGYEDTDIPLIACCPKGEDCGTSCKTADGIKDICVQEKKSVKYLTRSAISHSKPISVASIFLILNLGFFFFN